MWTYRLLMMFLTKCFCRNVLSYLLLFTILTWSHLKQQNVTFWRRLFIVESHTQVFTCWLFGFVALMSTNNHLSAWKLHIVALTWTKCLVKPCWDDITGVFRTATRWEYKPSHLHQCYVFMRLGLWLFGSQVLSLNNLLH